MKNLINSSIILLVLIATSNSYSQINNPNFYSENVFVTKNVSAKLEALGSPYIDENFKNIKIEGFDKVQYIGRYNAYNDEMEVKVKDKIIALDISTDYKVEFISDNKIYKTIDYITENDEEKRGFLVVIAEFETYSLLKQERINYYEGQEAISSYHKDKPAKFNRIGDSYYVQFEDKTIYLPQKKKEFLEIFKEKSSLLKSFIKEKKLNTKTEDNLKKIFEYLNEI
ncbi:MAG: hypothetical protein AB8B52_12310 [Winogradskyella sp.]|uniref:hypothetical protein n=1 Tax=Winogradskyella sp. TaxID=1883156 RepID=UPI00385815C7